MCRQSQLNHCCRLSAPAHPGPVALQTVPAHADAGGYGRNDTLHEYAKDLADYTQGTQDHTIGDPAFQFLLFRLSVQAIRASPPLRRALRSQGAAPRFRPKRVERFHAIGGTLRSDGCHGTACSHSSASVNGQLPRLTCHSFDRTAGYMFASCALPGAVNGSCHMCPIFCCVGEGFPSFGRGLPPRHVQDSIWLTEAGPKEAGRFSATAGQIPRGGDLPVKCALRKFGCAQAMLCHVVSLFV